MNIPFLRPLSAIALCLFTASAWAAEAPSRTECIAPAKPGGGFDLTCKLIQVSLMETGAIQKPMRVTYMPGGVGAVAYNAIVAQRPGEPGTVVAFSGGSLLNLAQGKFGRYGVDDVRWLASVGTDYGMIAVRADSPWKDLPSFMAAMEKKSRQYRHRRRRLNRQPGLDESGAAGAESKRRSAQNALRGV
ncbi:Tricarboxylate transport protein TctC [Klebsiella oxytoca]|nr:Tricarboxylate transport protein TctC [Klebsiella oxytoca]